MKDLIKAIMAMLPNISRTDAKRLKSLLGLDDAILVHSIEDLEDEEDGQKSITEADIASKLGELGYDVTLPGKSKSKKAAENLPYGAKSLNGEDDPEEDEGAEFGMKSIYAARFAKSEDAQKAVFEGVIGKDYQQVLFDQEVSFAKAMRVGESKLSVDELKSLNVQIFPLDRMAEAIISDGMSVAGLKATQVEAQGELGGFAVPAQRQSEIAKRLPGLTAIRGGGARVITLANSNLIELPQWRSASDSYIGLLRGTWAGEAAAPAAQNFKLDMRQVNVNLYTYKVVMSMSVVEDAVNLISMLMDDIVSTVAIDEDFVFILGDGVGKPEGILPGGANGNSLTAVLTGSAGVMTAAGIKGLKRGVPSQYRKAAKWIANSDTYGDIEALTAGAGNSNWAFPDLSETDMLLSREALESEGMPDVASLSFPVLFGNPAGYTIVERLGLAIERFHDSGTGINKVEYHVRKRTGGLLTEAWQWAVQQVTTT